MGGLFRFPYIVLAVHLTSSSGISEHTMFGKSEFRNSLLQYNNYFNSDMVIHDKQVDPQLMLYIWIKFDNNGNPDIVHLILECEKE